MNKYIKPIIKVFMVKSQQLMAGSPGPDAGGETSDINDLLGKDNGFDTDGDLWED